MFGEETTKQELEIARKKMSLDKILSECIFVQLLYKATHPDMFNVFRRNYGKTQLCALTSITPKMQFELTIFALIDQENGEENM